MSNLEVLFVRETGKWVEASWRRKLFFKDVYKRDILAIGPPINDRQSLAVDRSKWKSL